jgi:hypothetical protein
MCIIPKHIQDKFEHLILFPHLIVENLLMEQEISLVSAILNSVPEMQDDNMLLQYGKKALDPHPSKM